jgi:hypothetical protein
MKNTLNTAGNVFLFMFAMLASALAQNNLVSAPSPAVAGPAYDLSVGYTNLTLGFPSAGHANLSGVDASGSVALGRRWGATVDTSFLRDSNILGTPHQAYVLTSQGGPVFYPLDRGNTRVLLRGLVGAGLEDAAIPVNQTQYFHGWVLRPAYAVGGGMEHALSSQYTIRVVGDYLRTSFYDAAGAVQPQNSIRLTASFVFRLKEHPRRFRSEAP